MKNVNKYVLFVLFVLIIKESNFGQLTGSVHDFTNEGGKDNNEWFFDKDNLAENRLCAPCHTGQFSKTITNAPLWSHEMSNVASYTYYSSSTLNATDVDGQLGSTSKLCLSCHDGTVSLNNFEPLNGSGTKMDESWTAFIGLDLSKSHPVGFTYDDELASTDGELFFPSISSSNIPGGSTISNDLLFGPSNDQMECISCHDPHNKNQIPGMLRINNSESQLCLTCHNK